MGGDFNHEGHEEHKEKQNSGSVLAWLTQQIPAFAVMTVVGGHPSS
jgi:hypothetical protein